MVTIEKNDYTWATRRDVTLTIIGWILLSGIIVWVLAHFSGTIILLVIAAFLAYALVPLVTFLGSFLPRFLAILLVYLLVLTGLSFLIYFIVSTAIIQFILLSTNMRSLLTANASTHISPFMGVMNRFGISPIQLSDISRQITSQAEGLTSSVVPFLGSIFSLILDTILVAVISIYFLIDGQRLLTWVRYNMPKTQKSRVNFLLNTLQRIVGGYIRGQVMLAFLIGALVGIGMTLFHVPYAVLLGALAFVLEFIPVLGSLISGAICVLLALTQGWVIALLVLIYFIFIHVIESDLLGPRIVGQAIGLHPLVSIIAVIAGAELYGIIGVLFASPIAGVGQAILISLWSEWQATHPQEFNLQKKNT